MFGLKKNLITGEVFDMFLGLPGNGKSLTLVEDYVIPSLVQGIQVYCNFWVNWKGDNFHYFSEFEEISNVTNCMVVIDEIGNILDPRNWESENGDVRRFFIFHRHNSVDIVGNTQDISLIAKTALNQIDRYYMCEKYHVTELLRRLFGFPKAICLKTHQMTISDIKKLNMPVYSEEDEHQYKSLSTDFSWYSFSRLYHDELNKYKEELVHRFCPICNHRQGTQIKSDETLTYAVKRLDTKQDLWDLRPGVDLGNCPKHEKQSLELRKSSMYDSHYQPPFEEKEIIWKPFVMAEKLVPYRGAISPTMYEKREEVKKRLTVKK